MSRYIKEYSSFATEIDLVADDPRHQRAQRVVVITAGSGALELTVGAPGNGHEQNPVSLSALTAGETFDFQGGILAIGTGTTVALLRVFWDR